MEHIDVLQLALQSKLCTKCNFEENRLIIKMRFLLINPLTNIELVKENTSAHNRRTGKLLF